MTQVFQFTIYGAPQQRGSKSGIAIVNRFPARNGACVKLPGGKYAYLRNGIPMVSMMDMNKKSGPYMDLVRKQLRGVWSGRQLIDAPVIATFHYYFGRPKNHYRSGRSTSHLLTSRAPRHHVSFPDLSKLIRCTEDCLSGIVWVDDKQVIRHEGSAKHWIENTDSDQRERVEILIEVVENTDCEGQGSLFDAVAPSAPDNSPF